MKITNAEIIIVPPGRGRSSKGHLKAYVSITIDDCFIVRDLKIIRTHDKLFVAMPSKLDRHKNIHRDIAHPINKETRQMIQKAVFAEYDKQIQNLKLDEEDLHKAPAGDSASSSGLEDSDKSDD